MLTFEYILLGLTYTTLFISIFLQWVCYKRNIENIETIAFTVSLLLLIVSISLSPLFPVGETSNISTLIAMVLVSITTFLNTWSERKHSFKIVYKRAYLTFATLLLIVIFVTYFLDHLIVAQNAVVAFLIGSVLGALGLAQSTKPIKRYLHLEKVNKIFGLIFLILVPTYLIFHYGFEKEYQQFPIGFLLYIAFTLLALHKIYDDLQRLSLVNKKVEPQKQHFKNYCLTGREEEIARLLVQGITYQNISEQLFISLPTVKTHASNIYKKCNVKTRHELVFVLTA
ncbi:LuxR C-terminal-related transcriptional regulator [Flavobacterium azooxidireducens]|uniref:LuxR C-terminal-related transcriptional regulator n=1 Tax=Flavobacterium azooxidireducens TaxID=1871076 RepID=A0ABY4KD85_9FLAO|nr:LuxR C-terminal-related transcriptional regulator [Flavobacterium azooxidireducens]UPQ78756.1 LuxR C-terminal-related transcriptional regulator [Flavobacterium azooxidireducens]